MFMCEWEHSIESIEFGYDGSGSATLTGVDYNLTLCPLQSRLQYKYHGQPYARVDLNPMPELILSPGQGLHIWPL
jgi:hypothetical protein